MDLEKAAAFVRSEGDAVEQARLEYILTNETPSQEIVARLLARQRPDGGWSPFWADDYSSLDATCFRLAQASQLGVGKSETALGRALRFLTGRQSPQGYWEEDEKVAGLAPPWAAPGDLSARLYLTANCGFQLALMAVDEENASKAAGYLQSHLDPDGRLPGFLHTHWLAGGLWYRLNRGEPSEGVFEYLSNRIADLSASNLAWLITTLSSAGVPTTHPLVVKAASRLEPMQQEDGRWQSEDGPSRDVHATLEAIQALLWLGE